MDGNGNDKMFDLLIKQNESLFSEMRKLREDIAALTTKVMLYSSQARTFEDRIEKAEKRIDSEIKPDLRTCRDQLKELSGIILIAQKVRNYFLTAIAIGAVLV